MYRINNKTEKMEDSIVPKLLTYILWGSKIARSGWVDHDYRRKIVSPPSAADRLLQEIKKLK